MDVENEWGEKFEAILEKASISSDGYSPSWYSGSTAGLLGASALSSSIGSSLTSTISSSSPHRVQVQMAVVVDFPVAAVGEEEVEVGKMRHKLYSFI